MQGLAAIIAPATPSGNVLALFSGTLIDSATTVAEGIVLQMYYGPVISGTAPPANAGAIPASAVAIGPTQEAEDVFFHITEVEDRYLLNENDIRSGMRLAFEAVPGRGGRPAARQVRPVT
jgi:cold shock CspA family protein